MTTKRPDKGKSSSTRKNATPDKLVVEQIPCLQDNYGYLLHDPTSRQTAAIDTPDADAILATLDKRGWRLTHILNTHHHGDHIGGNLTLKEKTGCHIIGPAGEITKIPGLDEAVDHSDMVAFGAHYAEIINVGGHTSGHIAYYFRQQDLLFVGDALFVLGCGRIFEGTAAQMWASLKRLAALDPATIIYCAHEYTEANARFAISIDPDNRDLQARMKVIQKRRADNLPTVPTSLSEELATNPFLRADNAAIRQQIAMPDAPDVDVFAEIRARKDKAG